MKSTLSETSQADTYTKDLYDKRKFEIEDEYSVC